MVRRAKQENRAHFVLDSRYRRGAYNIVVDGVVVGYVEQERGFGWQGSSMMPHVSDSLADARDGYRGSRHEAAIWILDTIGLPASIATDMLLGFDLDEEQERWVTEFLKRADEAGY